MIPEAPQIFAPLASADVWDLLRGLFICVVVAFYIGALFKICFNTLKGSLRWLLAVTATSILLATFGGTLLDAMENAGSTRLRLDCPSCNFQYPVEVAWP